MEQAKLGDQVACPCNGGPHRIVSAVSTTFVDGLPVARVGDRSSCGASIVTGLDWYPIEGAAAAIHGSKTSCGGIVIAAASAVTGQPPSGARGASASFLPSAQFDEHFILSDSDTGLPLPNRPYKLMTASGKIIEGTTDENGKTKHATSYDAEAVSVEFEPQTEIFIG